MEDQYDGPERRSEYCPVHHIKCDEWKATEAKIDETRKDRVPIWVFVVAITIIGSVIGWMNINMMEESRETQTLLKIHIEKSNKILSALAHGVNEIAVNQQNVLNKLELPFQSTPHYSID